jgi:pimeloyl-ACP methyl ester carboxylesterase
VDLDKSAPGPVDPVEHRLIADNGLAVVADVFGVMTDRPPVLCIPGLTRNARDFTDVASILAADRLVVAVDLPGRGRSDADPTARSYTLDVYLSEVLRLCDALDLTRVALMGTSLGGLVAMHVGAAAPERIAGIVLNDIGPQLAPEGVARISSYAGKMGPVTTWAEAAEQTRAVTESQTPGLTEEEWLDEAHRRYRQEADGRIVADYDPGIVNGPPSSEDPWSVFDRLGDLPLLLLRGEFSDLLAPDTVSAMQALHPTMRAVEIPNRGHAPILNEPEALAAIAAFLGEIDNG